MPLMTPKPANPQANVRQKPHTAGVGNEKSADTMGAMSSNPGPGSKRNVGDANLSFNSKEIHGELD